MKKWIIIGFLIAFSAQIQAQETYNTLLNQAAVAVNTHDANDYTTKVNYFYLTALNYMISEMKPQDAAQYRILDEQALAMHRFVSRFIDWISHTPHEKLRRKGIKAFLKHGSSHPFFNDKDKETTLSFIGDPNYITPFSLDTDWVAANQGVDKTLNRLTRRY